MVNRHALAFKPQAAWTLPYSWYTSPKHHALRRRSQTFLLTWPSPSGFIAKCNNGWLNRWVITQPNAYQTANTCMLELKRMGDDGFEVWLWYTPRNRRSHAATPLGHDLGARGARINGS